jgi:hypothetical protein
MRKIVLKNTEPRYVWRDTATGATFVWMSTHYKSPTEQRNLIELAINDLEKYLQQPVHSRVHWLYNDRILEWLETAPLQYVEYRWEHANG